MTTGSRRSRIAPRVTCVLLAASLALAHALFLAAPTLLEPWQLQATDALFRLRADTRWGVPEVDNILVYVDQRDDTESHLGIAYFEREHYAHLVRNLAAMDVSVQAHDTLFRSPKDPTHDKDLVAATKKSRVAYGFIGRLGAAKAMDGDGGGGAPLAAPWRIQVRGDAGRMPSVVQPVANFSALAKAAAGQGFIDTAADMDGVVRRAMLLARSGDGFHPSLAFLAVCTHLGVTPDRIELRPGHSIRLLKARNGRDIVIPIDGRGHMRVNFLSWEDPRQTHFTFQTILDDRALEVLKERLAGHVALVSNVSTAAGDLAPSPLHRSDPLPALHGNVIHTILSEQFLSELGFWAMLVIEIMLLGVVYVLTLCRSTRRFLLGSLGLSVLYWAAATTAFCQFGAILHLIRPSLALAFAMLSVLAYRYLAEQRTRAVVQSSFERYFPPGVVRRLVDDPERLALGGERKELTVLFSDIVGFSGRATDMDPEEVQSMLNGYFESMIDIVFEHEGTLDKVIGDGMMVFFGDPEDQPDHALRCVRCAIAMQKRLRVINREWVEQGKEPIDIRVGINTGPMIVGNMGSPRRLSYTVIGSAVNLAARLEPKAPAGGILLSESTRKAVKDEIETRAVAPLMVKGFETPVAAYVVTTNATRPT